MVGPTNKAVIELSIEDLNLLSQDLTTGITELRKRKPFWSLGRLSANLEALKVREALRARLYDASSEVYSRIHGGSK